MNKAYLIVAAVAVLAGYGMYKRPKNKSFKIIIEGNAGSGKTTLLEYFDRMKHPDVEVVEEPVEEWRDVGGENLLDLFYRDPTRYSYLFQSYVLQTMLEIKKKKQNRRVMLIERSVYSATYCFVENYHLRTSFVCQGGNMSSVEYAVYRKWFDWVIKEEKPHVDLIVYLKTSPEISYQRIYDRNRKEENNIPKDLIEAIHQRYQDWLVNMKFEIPAAVLILDGDKGKDHLHEHYKKILETISLEQKKPL